MSNCLLYLIAGTRVAPNDARWPSVVPMHVRIALQLDLWLDFIWFTLSRLVFSWHSVCVCVHVTMHLIIAVVWAQFRWWPSWRARFARVSRRPRGQTETQRNWWGSGATQNKCRVRGKMTIRLPFYNSLLELAQLMEVLFVISFTVAKF